METTLPVLFTAIKELNDPRYPTVKGIINVFSKDQIKVFTVDDLCVDRTQIGLNGSPTKVFKTFVPTKSKQSEIIEGINAKETAEILVDNLKSLKVI